MASSKAKLNVLGAEVQISGFVRFIVRLIRLSTGFLHGHADVQRIFKSLMPGMLLLLWENANFGGLPRLCARALFFGLLAHRKSAYVQGACNGGLCKITAYLY